MRLGVELDDRAQQRRTLLSLRLGLSGGALGRAAFAGSLYQRLSDLIRLGQTGCGRDPGIILFQSNAKTA